MRNQCTRGSQCRFHHPTPEKTQKESVLKKTKTDIKFKNVKKPEVSFNWKRSQNTKVMEPPPPPPPPPSKPSYQERKPRMVVIYRRFSTSPQTRRNFNTNNTFYY